MIWKSCLCIIVMLVLFSGCARMVEPKPKLIKNVVYSEQAKQRQQIYEEKELIVDGIVSQLQRAEPQIKTTVQKAQLRTVALALFELGIINISDVESTPQNDIPDFVSSSIQTEDSYNTNICYEFFIFCEDEAYRIFAILGPTVPSSGTFFTIRDIVNDIEIYCSIWGETTKETSVVLDEITKYCVEKGSINNEFYGTIQEIQQYGKIKGIAKISGGDSGFGFDGSVIIEMDTYNRGVLTFVMDTDYNFVESASENGRLTEKQKGEDTGKLITKPQKSCDERLYYEQDKIIDEMVVLMHKATSTIKKNISYATLHQVGIILFDMGFINITEIKSLYTDKYADYYGEYKFSAVSNGKEYVFSLDSYISYDSLAPGLIVENDVNYSVLYHYNLGKISEDVNKAMSKIVGYYQKNKINKDKMLDNLYSLIEDILCFGDIKNVISMSHKPTPNSMFSAYYISIYIDTYDIDTLYIETDESAIVQSIRIGDEDGELLTQIMY